MTIQTLADITLTGAKVQLTTLNNLRATWIKFAATAGGRVGDVNVSSTRGLLIQANVVTEFPRDSFDQSLIDLSTVYLFGSSGTVSITYGV